jgi:hypothetical protein
MDVKLNTPQPENADIECACQAAATNDGESALEIKSHIEGGDN